MCPFCGEGPVDDDDRFCPYCGANLMSVEETEAWLDSDDEDDEDD